MHSVYDSSPRNNNILGPKREQKEDVTSRLSFWEKASFFFNIPKRAINITFQIRKSWLGLCETPRKTPSHHSPIYTNLIPVFHQSKHFHLPIFFHLTISWKPVDYIKFNLPFYLNAQIGLIKIDIIQVCDKRFSEVNLQNTHWGHINYYF